MAVITIFFYFQMAIFAEGTRLTEAKVQASVEYAREHGLPELKHHLLPRSRGFSMTVQYFKDKGKVEFPNVFSFHKKRKYNCVVPENIHTPQRKGFAQ